jgi:FkbM family methyltransferase
MPASLISGSTGLRSALRRSGLTRRLSALRPLIQGHSYEAKVDAALTALVRGGDCVWDVGANVGLYTERFARAVGSTGHIVAFEPISSTRRALIERVQSFETVQVRGDALGSASADVTVALDADATSPTNSLVRAGNDATGASERVRVVAADELVATGELRSPNVVKIDTEGYEEDVLWGMRNTLRAGSLRGLMIEVHFALLDGRGHRRAPQRIVSLLADAGFRVTWVDASHVLATRP